MPTDNLFLLPGEMAFCRQPTRISTLLGSCVAIALYDKKHQWGGLNHYMVCERLGALSDGKIGRLAIPGLLQLAAMAGTRVADLQARIFGGAAVIGSQAAGAVSALGDIGSKNSMLAVEMLEALKIPIIERHIGGTLGRRIHMDSTTGVVDVSMMANALKTDRGVNRVRATTKRTKVLIIDDSALVRRLISSVIKQSDDFEVVGEAENPFDARERILELNPDILCLDLIMPKIDGLSFLRRLMQYKPIPTVVISTIAKVGSSMYNKVMAAGAVAAIDKEDLHLYGDGAQAHSVLLPALRLAARQAAQLAIKSPESGVGS